MLSLVQSFSCISMWCFGELSHSAYEKDHFNIYVLVFGKSNEMVSGSFHSFKSQG